MRSLLMGGKADEQIYEIKSIAEEFCQALEAELDFTREASFTDKLRRNLSQSSWFDPQQIVVAEIYWNFSSLQWNLSIRGLDSLRRTMDDAANRLSFRILVGSLIMDAAIISSKAQTAQLLLVSNILFTVASLLGLWLIISILRSGRLN